METRDDKRREKDRRDEDHKRKDDDQRGDRRNEKRREKRDDYYESRKRSEFLFSSLISFFFPIISRDREKARLIQDEDRQNHEEALREVVEVLEAVSIHTKVGIDHVEIQENLQEERLQVVEDARERCNVLSSFFLYKFILDSF